MREEAEQESKVEARRARKGRGMKRANTVYAYEDHPETRHLQPDKMDSAALKEALEQRGAPTVGSKADLARRLTSLLKGGQVQTVAGRLAKKTAPMEDMLKAVTPRLDAGKGATLVAICNALATSFDGIVNDAASKEVRPTRKEIAPWPLQRALCSNTPVVKYTVTLPLPVR